MRPCFAFSNIQAADNKPAVLSIFDEIGFWGVQAKDFIAELGQVQGSALTVEINSPGGDVFAALAMYNALRASGKEITAKVMGVAASAASLIFMAGDKRVMPANTHLMVHNPWTFAMGNADELRDTAATLDSIGAALLGTYAARSGMSEDDLKALLAKDTWLIASEAKEKGFATEVIDEIKATAKFDMARADLPEAVRAVFASAAKPVIEPPAPAPAPAATPAPAPAATPAPAPAAAAPFADQVMAAAKAAGFEAHAGLWTTSFDTMDAVNARISECREIVALCGVVKSDRGEEFVRNGTTFAAAKKAIAEAAAAADRHIVTTPPGDPTNKSAASGGFSPTAMWAKRNKPTNT